MNLKHFLRTPFRWIWSYFIGSKHFLCLVCVLSLWEGILGGQFIISEINCGFFTALKHIFLITCVMACKMTQVKTKVKNIYLWYICLNSFVGRPHPSVFLYFYKHISNLIRYFLCLGLIPGHAKCVGTGGEWQHGLAILSVHTQAARNWNKYYKPFTTIQLSNWQSYRSLTRFHLILDLKKKLFRLYQFNFMWLVHLITISTKA